MLILIVKQINSKDIMKQLLIYTLLLFTIVTNGQRTDLIPPSTDAANMGIYGDVPIDLSKGTIDINIPLYKINVNGEEFPFSMSYNGSGIKVDQMASSVGLGWNFNGEGLVTRVVRGLPDDIKNSSPVDLLLNPTDPHTYAYNRQYTTYDNCGYFFSKDEVNNVKNLAPGVSPNATQIEILKKISLTALDSEPDEFYFNFFGVSGKFIFDQDKNIILLSKDPITIIPTITTSGIQSFKIILPNGIIYHFETKESTDLYRMSYYNGYYNKQSASSAPYKYSNRFWYYFNPTSIVEGAQRYPNFNLNDPTSIFENYDSRQKGPTYTSTWRISRVEIPNQSDITFNYGVKKKLLDFSYTKSVEQSLFRAESIVDGPNSSTPTYPNKAQTSCETYSILATITERQFLTNVQWETGKMQLGWENREDTPWVYVPVPERRRPGGIVVAPEMTFSSERGAYLTGIRVDDMKTGVETFSFNYSYFTTASCNTTNHYWATKCKRLKLNSITQKDGSKYTFEYENQFPLPSIGSLSKDFFGYYNGATNTDEIPSLYYYPNLVNNLENSEYFTPLSPYPPTSGQTGTVLYVQKAENNFPNLNYAKSGILKKIIYPTKGYTEFEYELNTFLHNGKEELGPGLRIKSTKTSDLVSPVIEKIYSYKNSDGLTSGNLHILPVFNRYRYTGENTTLDYLKIRNTFYSYNNIISNSNSVDYKTVTITTVNNGKEEYSFNVPLTIGKKKDYPMAISNGYLYEIKKAFPVRFLECIGLKDGNGIISNCTSAYVLPEISEDYFPFTIAPNYSWNTGQLLEKNIYDNTGKKVKKITNSYTLDFSGRYSFLKAAIGYVHIRDLNVPATSSTPVANVQSSNVDTEQVSGFLSNAYFAEGKYDYYIASSYYISAKQMLTKTEETDYYDTNAVLTTKEFSYGSDLQLKKTTSTNSNNGEKNIVSFKHIRDFSNSNAFGTTAIGKPVEIITEKIFPGNTSESLITKADLFLYKNNLLDKHYVLNTNKTLVRDANNPDIVDALHYKKLSVNTNGVVNFDPSYELQTNYTQYNVLGKPVEVKSRYGEKTTVYIWGYSDKLLIAKIDNTSYNEVAALIDMNNLKLLKGTQLIQQLDILRSSLTNSNVTTYNYYDDSYQNINDKSLWKLASITDSRAHTTNYKYDENGDLKFIVDHLGNVIEEYKYNYKKN